MKKLLFLAIGLTLITFMGCKEDRKVADVAGFSQNDSLQKIIDQNDNEINDIMETFNQIEPGFKEINEAENRVSLMKDGEGANRRQQLVENRFIINGISLKTFFSDTKKPLFFQKEGFKLYKISQITY